MRDERAVGEFRDVVVGENLLSAKTSYGHLQFVEQVKAKNEPTLAQDEDLLAAESVVEQAA